MTNIDIDRLQELAGLHYENKEEITKEIVPIMEYLSLLGKAEIDESEYMSDISNSADRNSGIEKFDFSQELLQNSHHPKINNSIVIEFKKSE